MKKFVGIMTMVLLAFLAGCSMQEESSKSALTNSVPVTANQPTVYKGVKLYDLGQYYVYDHDVFVKKTNTPEFAQYINWLTNDKTNMAAFGKKGFIEADRYLAVFNVPHKISPQMQHCITYSFDNNFTLQYTPSHGGSRDIELIKASVRRSFDKWEAVADIHFQEVSSGGLIKINKGATYGLALAWCPTLQAPTFIDGWDYIVSATLTFSDSEIQKEPLLDNIEYFDSLVLHELGHAIGLKHENERLWITTVTPGFPYGGYDSESIMSVENPNNVSQGHLSDGDKKVVQYMYGTKPDKEIGSGASPIAVDATRTTEDHYRVYANNLPCDLNIRFYTYTVLNGVDDIQIIPGTYDSANKRYYCDVKASDHQNESGDYQTDVYIFNVDGKEKLLGSATVQLNLARFKALPLIGNISLRNKATGNFVDDFGVVRPSALTVTPWGANNSQKWKIYYTSVNSFQIINDLNNYVFDVRGGSVDENAEIIEWDNLAGANQEWYLLPKADNQFVLQNKNSLKAVYNSGGRLIQKTLDFNISKATGAIPVPADEELWSIQSADDQLLINAANNKAISIPQSGSSLEESDPSGCRLQKWRFVYHTDGSFKISNSDNQQVIDVAGGNDWGQVISYPNGNGDNQQWYIVSVNNGSFQIISKCTGHALAFSGGQLVQKTANISDLTQIWKTHRVVASTLVGKPDLVSCGPVGAASDKTRFCWTTVSGAVNYRLYLDNVMITETAATSFEQNLVSLGSHTWTVGAVSPEGFETRADTASFIAPKFIAKIAITGTYSGGGGNDYFCWAMIDGSKNFVTSLLAGGAPMYNLFQVNSTNAATTPYVASVGTRIYSGTNFVLKMNTSGGESSGYLMRTFWFYDQFGQLINKADVVLGNSADILFSGITDTRYTKFSFNGTAVTSVNY